MVVPFAMLLNLAAVAATETGALWGFIRRYAPDASAETHPDLDQPRAMPMRYFNGLRETRTMFAGDGCAERAALEDLSPISRPSRTSRPRRTCRR
jgi:lysyl-tRNA synthetase class 1